MGLKINAKLYDIGTGYKSECHPAQALRSRNAWARVPLSTYSSSPPTGTPRACVRLMSAMLQHTSVNSFSCLAAASDPALLALQVRVAGDDDVGVVFAEGDERALQANDLAEQRGDFVAQPEAHVEGDPVGQGGTQAMHRLHLAASTT